MAHAHRVLLDAGFPGSALIHLPEPDDAAIQRIAAAIYPGDLVLLKGSRRMRLERVLEALRNRTFPRPLTAIAEPKPAAALAG
jgi:UDP-N-acetylmuramyl pentapeptide synthase